MYEELKARLLAWTKTSSSFGLDSIGKDIAAALEAIEELERQLEEARLSFDAGMKAEQERICAAIKAEDDRCADGDYMMDSDDCIKVVRGTWERPDWNGSNAK